MALAALERDVCRLIATNRMASGESYVAGGVALNELIAAPRISRHVDLFHDTDEAVEATWDADRTLLVGHGFEVSVLHERRSYVEAEVIRREDRVLLQWARDSAFRFFPLVRHDDLGLVLHPFDLATNKILALVGRLEVRDWIDVIECNDRVQPIGYLAWAACGKDPGFTPGGILEQAGRSSHYSAEEVLELAFAGEPPDPGVLSRRWHAMLDAARAIVDVLPPADVGRCVLERGGALYRKDVTALRGALSRGEIAFHPGRIRGAFPTVVGGTAGPEND